MIPCNWENSVLLPYSRQLLWGLFSLQISRKEVLLHQKCWWMLLINTRQGRAEKSRAAFMVLSTHVERTRKLVLPGLHCGSVETMWTATVTGSDDSGARQQCQCLLPKIGVLTHKNNSLCQKSQHPVTFECPWNLYDMFMKTIPTTACGPFWNFEIVEHCVYQGSCCSFWAISPQIWSPEAA